MNQFLLLFLILISSNLYADYGTVSRIRGIAKVQNLEGERRLRVNDKVFSGEIVETKEKSILFIKFSDKSTVKLGPKSRLKLNTIRNNETKILELFDGFIRAKFSKKKSAEYKLKIRTKTAIMGIRGTELNMIYNEKNNLTTTISLSGNVELSSKAGRKVSISPGQFSSVHQDHNAATKPAKISPMQFQAIKKNSNLDRSKRSNKLDEKVVVKIPKVSSTDNNQTDIPREMLGPGHAHLIDGVVEETKSIRPGGYIDFETGIYIEPPPGARFNNKEGVFEITDEFGSFDPETGEYIPPLGIILHPLKGFTVASNLITSATGLVSKGIVGTTGEVMDGAKIVGDKVIDGASVIGQKVISGATNVGNSVVSGLHSVGETLEENSGVVGSVVGDSVRSVGKGVRVVGDSVVNGATAVGKGSISGIKTTSDFIGKNTFLALNSAADNMNKYLNFGRYDNTQEKKGLFAYVNQLDLVFKNNLAYSNIQKFDIYYQTEEIRKTSSAQNKLHIAAQFKKPFYKKLFISPRYFIKKNNYTNKSVADQSGFDNYHSRYGVDIGVMGKVNDVMMQTYFYLDYGSLYRWDDDDNKHERYLWDKRFGFSKLILGSEYLTSSFDYFYTEYYSDNFDKGRMNTFKLSEIVKLKNNNYINLTLFYSNRFREKSHENILVRSLKLEYQFRSKVNSFKASSWGEYKLINDELFKSTRGNERSVELGFRLKKIFSRFFTTDFSYSVNKLSSASDEFDSLNFTTSVALTAVY